MATKTIFTLKKMHYFPDKFFSSNYCSATLLRLSLIISWWSISMIGPKGKKSLQVLPAAQNHIVVNVYFLHFISSKHCSTQYSLTKCFLSLLAYFDTITEYFIWYKCIFSMKVHLVQYVFAILKYQVVLIQPYLTIICANKQRCCWSSYITAMMVY